MISYIKGSLVAIEETQIIVEANGIGYQLLIPTSSISRLPSLESQVHIFTHLQVREDGFILYGFLDKEELEIFQQLISVTGIGPKVGIGILSSLTPSEVYFAILGDDIKSLCKAPGIGKKTAQRMILELKDKLSMENMSHNLNTKKEKTSQIIKDEAIAALIALGYQRNEAFRVIQNIKITDRSNVEEVIKEGLKRLTMMG
ncbi:MAG: Holliday junction branch migration protein RuvA [Epulopiscium sp.]|nr:Holliday junction branch migration protein RuvA [Candidatus Epulonipiscium sp.]